MASTDPDKNKPVDDDPYNCNSQCFNKYEFYPICGQIGDDAKTLKVFSNMCQITVQNCNDLNKRKTHFTLT